MNDEDDDAAADAIDNDIGAKFSVSRDHDCIGISSLAQVQRLPEQKWVNREVTRRGDDEDDGDGDSKGCCGDGAHDARGQVVMVDIDLGVLKRNLSSSESHLFRDIKKSFLS